MNDMFYMLRITDTDTFFALEEALDQFVMNTEDIEDELREDAADGDTRATETLRRLEAGRKLRDQLTGVLCSLVCDH